MTVKAGAQEVVDSKLRNPRPISALSLNVGVRAAAWDRAVAEIRVSNGKLPARAS